MKELSIEEKAKRYDRALEKARQLCAYPTSKPFISDLQDLFPELAESEDERMLRVLREGFNILDKDEEWYSGITNGQILAWLEKQGEQNPAWSKEDEWKFSDILALLRGGENCHYNNPDLFNWLKNLKDRVQPQPKQEWSDDDRIHYNKCLQYLESISPRKEDIEWFKSFKPQAQWKPSDEQIDALRYVTNFDYGGHKATLVSLYEQLKKLKG